MAHILQTIHSLGHSRGMRSQNGTSQNGNVTKRFVLQKGRVTKRYVVQKYVLHHGTYVLQNGTVTKQYVLQNSMSQNGTYYKT
jgi:hypothetical protein